MNPWIWRIIIVLLAIALIPIIVQGTTSLISSFGNTPLLTLNNFSAGSGALILGKQESRNPMGSVKCRIAVSMIETAEQAGIAIVNAKLYKDIKDDYDSMKKKLPSHLKSRLSKK